jgi:predicted membrane protein
LKLITQLSDLAYPADGGKEMKHKIIASSIISVICIMAAAAMPENTLLITVIMFVAISAIFHIPNSHF